MDLLREESRGSMPLSPSWQTSTEPSRRRLVVASDEYDEQLFEHRLTLRLIDRKAISSSCRLVSSSRSWFEREVPIVLILSVLVVTMLFVIFRVAPEF